MKKKIRFYLPIVKGRDFQALCVFFVYNCFHVAVFYWRY